MWAVWVKAWSAGSNWLSGGWGTAKGYIPTKEIQEERTGERLFIKREKQQ